MKKLRLKCAILFLTGTISCFCLVASASGAEKDEHLHGDAWAFGQSPDRLDPIWQKGVDGENIGKRARKQADMSAAPNGTDTSGGINKALNAVENSRRRGKLSIGVRDDVTTWKVNPMDKTMRPDEVKARDKSHVFGAYADVRAGDDFSVRIGPELIIKDENSSEGLANSSQPDSALGMGMKFKLDF